MAEQRTPLVARWLELMDELLAKRRAGVVTDDVEEDYSNKLFDVRYDMTAAQQEELTKAVFEHYFGEKAN